MRRPRPEAAEIVGASIAPSLSLPQRVLIGAVRAYRLLFSSSVGNACRFEPTCSAYALQALAQHGAAAGTYLTLHRIGRCHPFCAGGHDPVPGDAPALFRRFARAAASPNRTKPIP